MSRHNDWGFPGQLGLFDRETDICSSRHRNAPTSVEAYRTTPESVRNKQRGQVLAFVRQRGGATTEEVHQGIGIPYTAASARMSELKASGVARDSGLRRQTSHGKNAAVIVATA